MKTPDVPEASGMAKDKKQLLVLGGLSLVLLAVMAMQFGDDGAAPESAPESMPVAAAATSLPGAPEAVARPAEPVSNPVLSADPTGGGVNDGVLESFWDVATPMEAKVEEAPPPSITVNATLISPGASPLAVIDGRLHRAGDTIGGWSISEIGVRQVSLRSPSDRAVTVSMPLLKIVPLPREVRIEQSTSESQDITDSPLPSGDDA